MEEGRGSRIKQCQDAQGLERFLAANRPSQTSQSDYDWIVVHNPNLIVLDNDVNEGLLQRKWRSVLATHKSNPLSIKQFQSEIDAMARECDCLSGKWMLFVPNKDIDSVWSTIARAVMQGNLGD